jgi:hypothetical protein
MASKNRGSSRLPARIRKADLDRLLKLGRINGVELVEFFPLGIPGPDGGWGVWHVKPSALESLLSKILKDKTLPAVKIFPKGIPWPEIFEVAFEVGSGRTPQR